MSELRWANCNGYVAVERSEGMYAVLMFRDGIALAERDYRRAVVLSTHKTWLACVGRAHHLGLELFAQKYDIQPKTVTPYLKMLERSCRDPDCGCHRSLMHRQPSDITGYEARESLAVGQNTGSGR